MFSERLNQMMELTHTRASELARAANLNASHISRLKNGSRPLPKRPDFLPAMSAYLARRVRTDYQREELCRKLSLSAWPADEREASSLVEGWLLGVSAPAADMELLVRSFAGAGRHGAVRPEKQEGEPPAAKRYYYGPKGKQEAVMRLFDRVKKEKTPQTLLLSSDEDMGWMYENAAFAARWAAEFKQVLQMGNRVKIIHHVGRDLNELLEAVTKWMPIYMTGRIEPYYYPRLRDGVFRRTLFIAPKSAAVASASVGRSTEGMLNEFVVSRQAVTALAREFENYFALCRPLMKIVLPYESPTPHKLPFFYFEGDGDSIAMAGAPTLATMPRAVAAAMQARAPKSRILELRDRSSASLEQSLSAFRHTDILPGAEAAAPPLPCADFLGAQGLRYTPKELEAHWENVKAMAAENKNYRLVVDKNVPANLLLYGKEGHGTLLVKSDGPSSAFVISEANLSSAFWDYLEAKAGAPPEHF